MTRTANNSTITFILNNLTFNFCHFHFSLVLHFSGGSSLLDSLSSFPSSKFPEAHRVSSLFLVLKRSLISVFSSIISFHIRKDPQSLNPNH